MQRLIAGYQDFRKTRWPREKARYEEAAKGQKPEYLIIACSDLRSDPATIFGAHPGEFFLVRNIAALVPEHDATNGVYGTRAAIAYAVLALKVRNIVVMGHAQCGGIGAAVNRNPPKASLTLPIGWHWQSPLLKQRMRMVIRSNIQTTKAWIKTVRSSTKR